MQKKKTIFTRVILLSLLTVPSLFASNLTKMSTYQVSAALTGSYMTTITACGTAGTAWATSSFFATIHAVAEVDLMGDSPKTTYKKFAHNIVPVNPEILDILPKVLSEAGEECVTAAKSFVILSTELKGRTIENLAEVMTDVAEIIED